jgi:hypothetical protein
VVAVSLAGSTCTAAGGRHVTAAHAGRWALWPAGLGAFRGGWGRSAQASLASAFSSSGLGRWMVIQGGVSTHCSRRRGAGAGLRHSRPAGRRCGPGPGGGAAAQHGAAGAHIKKLESARELNSSDGQRLGMIKGGSQEK